MSLLYYLLCNRMKLKFQIRYYFLPQLRLSFSFVVGATPTLLPDDVALWPQEPQTSNTLHMPKTSGMWLTTICLRTSLFFTYIPVPQLLQQASGSLLNRM